MKLKRWDTAEHLTPRIALGLIWHADGGLDRLCMLWLVLRNTPRAILLKLGLVKPYEWVEHTDLIGWGDRC